MFTDDFGSTVQNHGTLAVGSTVTGKIEVFGDQDWFAVELTAGTTYRFDVEGTQYGLLGNYFGLFNSQGNLIAEDDFPRNRLNSQLFFTTKETGTYYAAVSAVTSFIGSYTLSVAKVEDDFRNNSDTVGRVEVGGSVTGIIQWDSDEDWFAVELTAGTIYQFDQEGSDTEAGTLSDPLFRLYNSQGNLIGENDDGGIYYFNSQLSFTAEETGTYYAAAGADDHIGSYTLSVAEVEDDFGNNSDTSGRVKVGGSVTGIIQWGADEDWFAVELTAGTIYQFDLKGSGTGARTLSDPLFRLYNSQGNLIGSNDDGGVDLNSQLSFTAEETGTYYASAGVYEGIGSYTLSVAVVEDDFGNDSDTLGRVEVGGSVTGTIDWGADEDWFAVELTAGTIYQFDQEGSETGAGTLSDPLFRLYNSQGNLIGENDDFGDYFNSQLSFTAEETGTYYAAAGAYGHIGSYTLSVAVLEDDFGNDSDTLGRVEVEGSVTGTINWGADEDWFAVELTAGTTYLFDQEGSDTEAGTLSDPLFRLYNSQGNLIRENDFGDYFNSQLSFRAEETGTYYASAGAHEDIGSYTLSVDIV